MRLIDRVRARVHAIPMPLYGQPSRGDAAVGGSVPVGRGRPRRMRREGRGGAYFVFESGRLSHGLCLSEK